MMGVREMWTTEMWTTVSRQQSEDNNQHHPHDRVHDLTFLEATRHWVLLRSWTQLKKGRHHLHEQISTRDTIPPNSPPNVPPFLSHLPKGSNMKTVFILPVVVSSISLSTTTTTH